MALTIAALAIPDFVIAHIAKLIPEVPTIPATIVKMKAFI